MNALSEAAPRCYCHLHARLDACPCSHPAPPPNNIQYNSNSGYVASGPLQPTSSIGSSCCDAGGDSEAAMRHTPQAFSHFTFEFTHVSAFLKSGVMIAKVRAQDFTLLTNPTRDRITGRGAVRRHPRCCGPVH